jgi:acetyl esterase/lipase
LGIGDLDLFLDEVTNFAARLSSHGVKVESRVYPGVPHCFDAISAISLGAELRNDETKFIQQF